jgi:hypothetical protein
MNLASDFDSETDMIHGPLNITAIKVLKEIGFTHQLNIY